MVVPGRKALTFQSPLKGLRITSPSGSGGRLLLFGVFPNEQAPLILSPGPLLCHVKGL